MERKALIALLDSLRQMIERLKLPKVKTEWANYYRELTHYSTGAEAFKKKFVGEVFDTVRPGRVLDLGGNIGHYSRVATSRGIEANCCDIDPLCVNENYCLSRNGQNPYMLPLRIDLTNPAASHGFESRERPGFMDRAGSDLTMALALVHHLRITGNIPFHRVASFLARISPWLNVEFPDHEDPMVQRLLTHRQEVRDEFTPAVFEEAFATSFRVERRNQVPETSRTLYLMRRL
jgi:hypothetical protein